MLLNGNSSNNMATAMSTKNEKRELSCSICRSTMPEMTVSSCFHTFCKKCLDGHIRSSRSKTQYECPICNTSVTLSSELGKNSLRDPRRPESVYTGIPWNEYCDICSGKVPGVNRCLECNESFCDNCTMVHMRMKASRYQGHRVVPLWDDATMPPYDETQKFCPRHRNEEIIVVCKQCKVLLCLICKLMEHEHHVTRLISEEAEDVRRNLSDVLQHQIGLSESLHTKKEMLHSNKSHIARGLDNEIAKIRHQASKLELQIDKEKTEKERELIEHYESLHRNNTNASEVVNEDFEEFASISKKAQFLLDHNDDVGLVREGPGLYAKLSELEQNRTPLNVGNPSKTFVPGSINERSIDQMLGYVGDRDSIPVNRSRESLPTSSAASERPVTGSVALLRASLVSSFQIHFLDTIGYIYGIAPVGNNKAWVTMLEHPEVTLVDVNGTVIDQVHVGEACDGVATDWHGGCFVSCPNSQSVKHIIVYGATKLETILENLSKDPHGIATMRTERGSEELFVCFTDTRGIGAAAYDSPKGCVRLFSFMGDDHGVSFTVQAPVRIDVDSKSELLCISDHSNRCVLVCDKTGKFVKALYTGDDTPGEFRPLGVCFDPFGGVLIANWKSGKIQRITVEGDLIQNLLVDLDGPQAIAVDDSRQLWVGCKQGRVQVYKLE